MSRAARADLASARRPETSPRATRSSRSGAWPASSVSPSSSVAPSPRTSGISCYCHPLQHLDEAADACVLHQVGPRASTLHVEVGEALGPAGIVAISGEDDRDAAARSGHGLVLEVDVAPVDRLRGLGCVLGVGEPNR